jgi:hypothetical protein
MKSVMKISPFPGADNYSARQDVLCVFRYIEENKSFSTERYQAFLHFSLSYVQKYAQNTTQTFRTRLSNQLFFQIFTYLKIFAFPSEVNIYLPTTSFLQSLHVAHSLR